MPVDSLRGTWRTSPMDTFGYFEFKTWVDQNGKTQITTGETGFNPVSYTIDNDTIKMNLQNKQFDEDGYWTMKFWYVPSVCTEKWFDCSWNCQGIRKGPYGTTEYTKIIKLR